MKKCALMFDSSQISVQLPVVRRLELIKQEAEITREPVSTKMQRRATEESATKTSRR